MIERAIHGYRELDELEIVTINRLKQLEADLAGHLLTIERALVPVDPDTRRWLALARDYLETGFMHAVKAVARPEAGLGRLDR
jgi:hypothetical protein